MNSSVPKSDVIEVASAALPTRSGDFRIHVFESSGEPSYLLSREQVALVKGNPRGTEPVLVRIQSECLTGEVFGSLRCDCRAQLRKAQELIQGEAKGVLLYLRQEGRGIGLANKIRAYALQDEGLDTVDANLRLHLPADARDYQLAAKILERFGVSRVKLLTNNLDKQQGIERWGIEVVERLPLEVGVNRHSAAYLQTKRTRMNHQGKFDEPEEPSGHH